ncbi:MAG: hypothetical protein N2V77_00005 [Canidatus Methanoxibalbensis ujae]|nr:hypothetical protein [Candidatus Methanoxibalbensis ujae]MCW7078762.1 hypothetical protein [Candidatus Methanoxibalbensis ujae]
MKVPEIFGYHRNYLKLYTTSTKMRISSKYENCGRKPVISEETKKLLILL